jgi:hypothetical protein
MPIKRVSLKRFFGKAVIVIRAFRDPDFKTISAIVRESLRLRFKNNCALMLIDGRRNETFPSIVEIFERGLDLSSLDDFREFRFAIVSNSFADEAHDFITNILNNYSIEIKIFTNYNKAKFWLLENK